MFTRKELENFTRIQLIRLAKYIGVQTKRDWTKEKLIEELLKMDMTQPPEYSEPVMSVRVRRIYESSKENNQ